MEPETLLVFKKYRKNFRAEAEKEGTFPVVTIKASIVGEYVWFQKGMKYVASSLDKCRGIRNVVHV